MGKVLSKSAGHGNRNGSIGRIISKSAGHGNGNGGSGRNAGKVALPDGGSIRGMRWSAANLVRK
eukprot:1158062-Pelagomonas_calceolata.AAC.4